MTMTETPEHNLRHWSRFDDIDPKFTKAITGKPYKGTSPNPQYVIRCLTEIFGPVGVGFGWHVIVEGFQPLGEKTLHWCRIQFWHTDRANAFESYGQTMAVYKTKDGFLMVDEDAPKKSLTDAIIKAASHVGIAANIFLGRWEDQKHLAEVEAEYRAKDKPAPQSKPAEKAPPRQEQSRPAQRDNRGAADHAQAALANADSLEQLRAIFEGLPASVRSLPEVIGTKDNRKAELQPKTTRPADSADADEIPYEGK
jgi:hypothetical protein